MQHVKIMDPSEMQNRYAQGIPYEDIEYRSEDSVQSSLDKIMPLLDCLPPREADILKLFYMQGKKQVELAKMFRVTQAAICYRINRGIQRLKFLLEMPDVEPGEMKQDLLELFDEQDVRILLLMYKYTCQSQVAKEIGSTQCSVRHRFLKAIKRLNQEKELDEKFEKYHELFKMISQNLNILHEITHPQWKAVQAVID
jgi:hypothetical protein